MSSEGGGGECGGRGEGRSGDSGEECLAMRGGVAEYAEKRVDRSGVVGEGGVGGRSDATQVGGVGGKWGGTCAMVRTAAGVRESTRSRELVGS